MRLYQQDDNNIYIMQYLIKEYISDFLLLIIGYRIKNKYE